jgi:hypothetical protein
VAWEEVFPQICKSLLRITARHSAGEVSATGFVVARYAQPGELEFAIATAEHVFQPLPANENVYWTIESFGWRGEPLGWSTFTSNLEALGKSPIRANLVSDVGLLFSPPTKFDLEVVRLLHASYAIRPGAKAGWAGFPRFVSQRTGDPRPCYFEGVISSVVDRVDQEARLFYLVDGHGGQGVSGGPLWIWDDATDHYAVIGLCSQYIAGEPESSPGMVVFEAVNPIVGYVGTSSELKMDIAS